MGESSLHGVPQMKKTNNELIMICIIVGCLASAVVVSYRTFRGSSSGIASIKRGNMIWVKCNKPGCGAEYQIDQKDYFAYIEEHIGPADLFEPPLVCKECNAKSVYRAIKCEQCGHTFFYGTVRNDFADRCPKCGYSAERDRRKTVARREE